MGFLDSLKTKFGSSKNQMKQEEINAYLKTAKDNLKSASDNIGRFLESMRDFQPARRHEPLYYEQVKERLLHMKAGIHKGVVMVDERLNNTINTLNVIKSPAHLSTMIGEWTKNIQSNDEKVYDILKILQVEMWGEEKLKRGFPVPSIGKDAVCGYLVNCASYLTQAKNNLDSYTAFASMVNTV